MRAFALGLLAGVSVLVPTSLTRAAAYVPPGGYQRVGDTFAGDAFAVAPDGKVATATANFSGGAAINVYANAAAAHAGTSPTRTFTAPAYKAWGDLTFADNDTLLFTENGGAAASDAVYRGIVSTGGVINLGNVPNAGGVVAVGSTVYAVAANNPGQGAVYQLTGATPTPVISNVGTGYLGGIAVDSAGNLLLTDSNDPNFLGNTGKLLRYTSGFSSLPSIDLTGGGGSGAYDVVLDSEGDAFVTTGATITQVPHGTTTASEFGSTFTGFPFLTSLDYAGAGFEPFTTGTGTLWTNAVFSDDGAILGVTPAVPEPAAVAGAMLFAGAVALGRRRRRSAARVVAASLAVGGGFSFLATSPARAAEHFYAIQVIDRTVGTQQQAGFTDPIAALDNPLGGGTDSANTTDVYNLGNGGSLTLGFDDATTRRGIFNGPGVDFIVSENAFYSAGDPHASFAELVFVEVSSDGTHFARFPVSSATPSPVGPFGTIDPANVSGFAGVNPVLANPDLSPLIDPFDPAQAGGDAFDLSSLASNPLVTSGDVNLGAIRFVRMVDVIGDGTSLDSLGRPIYDPTGVGIGGADIDAVTVINGVTLPEPTGALSLIGIAVAISHRRRVG